MAQFRDLLEEIGHSEVVTYLQSGSAVFSSVQRPGQRSETAMAGKIEKALATTMSVDVRALVLSGRRLGQVIEANPMARLDDDPTHLHVAFLSGSPKAGDLAKVDMARFAPDRFEVVGDVAYLHYPHGMGKSKLEPGTVFGRLGVWATARNWRTVNALQELVTGR